MLKKIVLGGLLIGLVGFLIAGAVIRTNAVAGSGEASNRHVTAAVEVAANGQGGGQSGRRAEQDATGTQPRNDQGGEAVRGGGNGGGAAGALAEPLADVQPADWTSFAGTVISAAPGLVEVETPAGAIIPFEGRPLSYALEQGFALTPGDAVLLHGFDEDGEFKLGQVDNLTTGAFVTLRDAAGRPGWAGRGRQ